MVNHPKILSGRIVADNLLNRVRSETAVLAKSSIRPGLAVVIVGHDPASQVYVNSKGKKAEERGFLSVKHELPEEVSEADLLNVIRALNEDPSVHGILVQLPLPAHIRADKVIQSISPDKDVDGFHYDNVGKLGTGAVADTLVPCTPAGCMVLIEEALGADLSGLDAFVIGRSNIVVVKSDWVKEGAVVIDVGINRLPVARSKSRLVGDVDLNDVLDRVRAITPVPGGVGPMTIALLMANTLRTAYRAHGLPRPDLKPDDTSRIEK